MMGTTKLATMRERVRKSFDMTDAELSAWFEQQMDERRRKPKADHAEIASLRMFRDALLKETKMSKPKLKRKSPRSPAKS